MARPGLHGGIVFVLATLLCVTHALTVTSVERVVDTNRQNVRSTTTYELDGVSAGDTFVFLIPSNGILSFWQVAVDGTHAPAAYAEGESFKVPLVEGNTKVRVFAIHHDVLKPFPSVISQLESQYVLFEDLYTRIALFNEYDAPGVKHKVTIMLPHDSDVRSCDPPVSVRSGTKKIFENFEDAIPIRIHFSNNSPFARFTKCEREIEISHWGAVQVEEVYALEHNGAELRDGLFSRFEHMMNKEGANGPSFRWFHAHLPSTSHDEYYRDIIGNISTSSLRRDVDGTTGYNLLETRFRFPLFGGWRLEWHQGYVVPLETFVDKLSSSKYRISVELGHPFREEGIITDQLVVRLVLPPGATDVAIESSGIPTRNEPVRDVRYTYLDSQLITGGRTTIEFTFDDVVGPELRKRVSVSYSHADAQLLLKPGLVAAAVFAFSCAALFASAGGSSSAAAAKKKKE